MKKCHMGIIAMYTNITFLIHHVHCNALLEVISPPDSMTEMDSAVFNRNTGNYQVG